MIVKFLNRNLRILFIFALILLIGLMSLFNDSQRLMMLRGYQIIFIISLIPIIIRLSCFYKKNYKGKVLNPVIKIKITLVHIFFLTIPFLLYHKLFTVFTEILHPFIVSGWAIVLFTVYFVVVQTSSNKFAQGMSNEKITNSVKTVLPQKRTNLIDNISLFISDLIDLLVYLYLKKIKKEYAEANLIEDKWSNPKTIKAQSNENNLNLTETAISIENTDKEIEQIVAEMIKSFEEKTVVIEHVYELENLLRSGRTKAKRINIKGEYRKFHSVFKNYIPLIPTKYYKKQQPYELIMENFTRYEKDIPRTTISNLLNDKNEN